MNLVLVEDDTRVSDFLERGLRAEGHGVSVVGTGSAALTLLVDGRPDVVVLDLMLPDMSGLDVCHELRAARNPVLVLMLTALDSTEHKVTGLRMGADDYMTKPFSFDELLARIEALHRRAVGGEPNRTVLRVGTLTFNRDTVEVRRDNRLVELTAKELALLELFMTKPGHVFSRARILSSVWGASTDPLTNVVDVYIRRLRSKLDEADGPSLISTVRGIGYRLEPGNTAKPS